MNMTWSRLRRHVGTIHSVGERVRVLLAVANECSAVVATATATPVAHHQPQRQFTIYFIHTRTQVIKCNLH